MTKEHIIDMFSMRYDGYSLEQIGEKYNVSKQFVEQCIDIRYWKERKMSSKVVYPNIRDWMYHNDCSVRNLGVLMSFSSKTNTSESVRILLYGRREMRTSDIKKIREITGLSLEQIIERDDHPEKENNNA